MTSFRKSLQDLVSTVDGGLGAVIMGYDGIAIEEYVADDAATDLQLLAVEYAHLLKEVKHTVAVLKSGELEEIIVATATAQIVVRALNDDFFVMLLLGEEGNVGKARFLLRRAAPELRDELQ